jgi:hypothetical protein
MGRDIYLRWDGMTEADKQAQYTGYSVEHGHVGYLREASHGNPYATDVLFTGDWGEIPEDGLVIENATLKERLPETIKTAIRREVEIYHGVKIDMNSPVVKSFADFVQLHGEKEKAGLNPRIEFSY